MTTVSNCYAHLTTSEQINCTQPVPVSSIPAAGSPCVPQKPGGARSHVSLFPHFWHEDRIRWVTTDSRWCWAWSATTRKQLVMQQLSSAPDDPAVILTSARKSTSRIPTWHINDEEGGHITFAPCSMNLNKMVELREHQIVQFTLLGRRILNIFVFLYETSVSHYVVAEWFMISF